MDPRGRRAFVTMGGDFTSLRPAIEPGGGFPVSAGRLGEPLRLCLFLRGQMLC